MSNEIFVSEKNLVSQRWANFEDDGFSGWLYLSEPNQERPSYDCWIYNRIPAPKPDEIEQFRGSPPPASSEYVGQNSMVAEIDEDNVKFKWSNTGNEVAILINEVPFGYILCSQKTGFSRNLTKQGPWGEIFDQSIYETFFNED